MCMRQLWCVHDVMSVCTRKCVVCVWYGECICGCVHSVMSVWCVHSVMSECVSV